MPQIVGFKCILDNLVSGRYKWTVRCCKKGNCCRNSCFLKARIRHTQKPWEVDNDSLISYYPNTSNIDMQLLLKHYREEYNIPTLKLQYNARRGHFFSLDESNVAILPDIFIQIVKKGKKLTASTEDLIRLNQRSNDSLSEISLMTERLLSIYYHT